MRATGTVRRQTYTKIGTDGAEGDNVCQGHNLGALHA